MARMQRSLFEQLNALSAEISQGAVKSASTKKADGPVPADPGTYDGSSSHPTANVDNNVQKAETGARASEYEADIKKQQGALAVDNTPELSQEGRQDEVQLNIGTNAAATGEEPSVEQDYKGTKDDPGTSHPAKANEGEKYSSVTFKEAAARCSALGNDILATLLSAGTKQAGLPPALAAVIHEKKESPAKEKAEHKGGEEKADDEADEKEAAFKAGYELAAALGLSKEAAEASVREVCASTLRQTDEMANLYAGFALTLAKQAEADMGDEASEGEDHSAPGDDASGAEAAAPESGPAGAAAAGGAPPATGGDAADALMGAGGDEHGGAPSQDEAVQELAMALEELGIPPEALIQAMQGAGGAGDAGAAGGMPPEAAPKMAAARDLYDIGAAVVNFKRAGKFQVKEARTKRSRQLRDIMKRHVLELVNR